MPKIPASPEVLRPRAINHNHH